MSFWRMAATALPYPMVAATALPLRHLFGSSFFLLRRRYGRNCVAILPGGRNFVAFSMASALAHSGRDCVSTPLAGSDVFLAYGRNCVAIPKSGRNCVATATSFSFLLVAYSRNCVAISTVAATALPLAPDLPFAVWAARKGPDSSGEREGEGSSDGWRFPALLLGRIFLSLPVMEACAVTWNQLDVPCSAVFLDQGRRCPGRRPSTHEPLRSRPERNLSAAINASAGSE